MKNLFLSWLIILTLSSFTNAQGNLDSLLVVSLPFNGNALDESGNENDGIVTGATLTEDRFGNANSAYLFNGLTDIISIPYSNSLEFTDEITLSAWINVESKEIPYLGRIINKNIGPNLNSHPFGMYHGYTNYIYAQVDDYTDDYTEENNIFTESLFTADSIVREFEWEHIVTTWDSDSLKIYVNCDLIATVATEVVKSISSNESAITIGNQDDPGMISGILGKIDDVRIYARAITLEEVKILSSCETTIDTDEVHNASFDLFPNPAFNQLNIVGLPYRTKINIYNSFGQTMKSLMYDGQTIDISSLKTGVYLIQASLNDRVLINKKLVKK